MSHRIRRALKAIQVVAGNCPVHKNAVSVQVPEITLAAATDNSSWRVSGPLKTVGFINLSYWLLFCNWWNYVQMQRNRQDGKETGKNIRRHGSSKSEFHKLRAQYILMRWHYRKRVMKLRSRGDFASCGMFLVASGSASVSDRRLCGNNACASWSVVVLTK